MSEFSSSKNFNLVIRESLMTSLLMYEFAHRRHHTIYKLTSKGKRTCSTLLNLQYFKAIQL